jgi:glycosyltransferase involved in cell wall biosynthesis
MLHDAPVPSGTVLGKPPSLIYVGTLPPYRGGSAIHGARLLRGLSQGGWSVRAIAPIIMDHAAEVDPFATAERAIEVARFPVPYYEASLDDVIDSSYRELQTASIERELGAALVRAPADIVLIGRESFIWGVHAIARRHAALTVQLVQGQILAVNRGFRSPELGARLMDEINASDLVIAVADHAAAAVRAIGIEHCISIPNAVDTAQFRETPKDATLLHALGFDRECLVVLHPSNLVPIKRPLDIVESAERCLAQVPTLRYLVVGDGPCRAAMEAECRNRGLASRFRFVGWVDHSTMPGYYGVADVVVMPSTSECFALAYLETQACGRVLLASDVSGAREAVEEGKTGLLFPVGDVDSLTAKTLALARDPQLRARIGRNARRAAEARELALSVAVYATTLHDLIARRRSKPRLSV